MQQVAFADRLLLNKIDLVSDKEKAEVVRVIKVSDCFIRKGLQQTATATHLGQFVGSVWFCKEQCGRLDIDLDCDPHLQGINSQAQIIECKLAASAPDIEQLLGLGAFNLDRILDLDSTFLQVRIPADSFSHKLSH